MALQASLSAKACCSSSDWYFWLTSSKAVPKDRILDYIERYRESMETKRQRT